MCAPKIIFFKPSVVVTDPPTVEGNAESALVVGLTPWTDYLFRVVASNILGVGEPSAPSSLVRTKEAGKILTLKRLHVTLMCIVNYCH